MGCVVNIRKIPAGRDLDVVKGEGFGMASEGSKVGLGIVGAGSIADVHLQAYAAHPAVRVVALADVRAEAARGLANRYGLSRTATDYRELLDDPAVELIDLCLPHFLHCPVALEAFQAGKSVIVEKPMALTVAECEAMIEAAQQAGKRLFVAHNMRFMPAHMRAKELLEAGAIGRPFLAIFNIIGNEFANMNDPQHWKGSWDRAGGGVFFDTGMHAVYMLEHFFGLPAAVTAVMKRLVVTAENKAEDNAVVTFEFPQGLLATVAITYTALAHPWDEQRHLYGTEGSLHIRDSGLPPLTLRRGGTAEAVPVEILENLWMDSVAAALHHFIDCYRTGTEPVVTPEQALRAVHMATAAYEAARTERRIVL